MILDQETAYRESARRGGDYVSFWREGRFDNMECLSARFENHRYVPHIHDTYALGVILSGIEAFRYRGAENLAGPGQVVCVNPYELHDGRPGDKGFGYRMFYPSLDLVAEVASDIAEKPVGPPMIREAVIDDVTLAWCFLRLHHMMERKAPRLLLESTMAQAIAKLLLSYGDFNCTVGRLGRESGPIARVREYLDAHYAEEVSLTDLSEIASLSRFHLFRSFRKEMGATPHAYLLSRRVSRAKKLLSSREPLSAVALDCGFFDQSHFSRTFKAWTGVTPAAYRKASNILQDAA